MDSIHDSPPDRADPTYSLWKLVVYALRLGTFSDFPSFAILLAALLLLWKVKKLPEPVIVGLSAAAELIVVKRNGIAHMRVPNYQSTGARNERSHRGCADGVLCDRGIRGNDEL